MLREATKNVISQGVNVLTGQQEKFNWSSLAVSAITAPISDKIDRVFGSTNNNLQNGTFVQPTGAGAPFSLERLGSNLTGEFLKSATRAAANILVNRGGKLDWSDIATRAFGNAIGNTIADDIKYRYSNPATSRAGVTGQLGGLIALDTERGAQAPRLATQPAGVPYYLARDLSLDNNATVTGGPDSNEHLENYGSWDDPAGPDYDVAERGDTLSQMVARKYGAGYDKDLVLKVAEYNKLADAHSIREGQRIFLPDRQELSGQSVDPAKAQAFDAKAEQYAAEQQANQKAAQLSREAQISSGPFLAPYNGTTTPFGGGSASSWKLPYGFAADADGRNFRFEPSFSDIGGVARDAADAVDAIEKHRGGLRISDTKKDGVVSVRGSAEVRAKLDLEGVKTIGEKNPRLLEAVGKGGPFGSGVKLGGTVIGAGLAVANDVIDYTTGRASGTEALAGGTTNLLGFGASTVVAGAAVAFLPVRAPILVIAGVSLGVATIAAFAYDNWVAPKIKAGLVNSFGGH